MHNNLIFWILFLLTLNSYNSFKSYRNPRLISRIYEEINSNNNNVNEEPRSDVERIQENHLRSINAVSQALIATQLLSSSEKVDAAARGYKAAQSVYAPCARLYRKPGLPQSALLNSLPFTNELIGTVQSNLESFALLIKPTAVQKAQIARNTSTLWYNLKVNAQRAAGMFLYNQAELELQDDKLPKDLLPKYMNVSAELAEKAEKTSNTRELPTRKFLEEKALSDLRTDALKLVNASRAADRTACLKYMNLALLRLLCVSSYLVPLNSRLIKLDPETLGPVTPDVISIPRLVGRAEVLLTYSKKSGLTPEDRIRTIKIVVDGLNYPMSGGSFIELCKRGFYDNLQVKSDLYDVPELDGIVFPSSIDRVILGTFPPGYRDPITNTQRRIPLEVFRMETNGTRKTIFGAAKNTAVFTKSSPVHSLSTPGALAMLHQLGDRNGASASFFTPRPAVPLSSQLLERLDKRFAVFAFVVQGLDVLPELREDDVLIKAEVEPGPWQLIRLSRNSDYDGINENNNNGNTNMFVKGNKESPNDLKSVLLYSGYEPELD
tara:strand:- start:372 stop:2021 length:1650 start_codon:yes stop_codon:yes gene_type:complete